MDELLQEKETLSDLEGGLELLMREYFTSHLLRSRQGSEASLFVSGSENRLLEERLGKKFSKS